MHFDFYLLMIRRKNFIDGILLQAKIIQLKWNGEENKRAFDEQHEIPISVYEEVKEKK